MTGMYRIRAGDTGPFVNVFAECLAEVPATLMHSAACWRIAERTTQQYK